MLYKILSFFHWYDWRIILGLFNFFLCKTELNDWVHLSIESAVVNRISLVMLYVCSLCCTFLMEERKTAQVFQNNLSRFSKVSFCRTLMGFAVFDAFPLPAEARRAQNSSSVKASAVINTFLPVLLTACEREKVLCFFGAPSKGKRLTGTTETQRINSGMRLCVRE